MDPCACIVDNVEWWLLECPVVVVDGGWGWWTLVLTIDIVKDGGGQSVWANEVDIPPPPENSLNMVAGQPTSPLSATERERHSQCGIGWIAHFIVKY